MNIKRRPRTTAEVSTSSLNDIMFFLLLFFLIASTLANPDIIKMQTPKSTNKIVAPKSIVVNIDEKGQVFINHTPTDIDHLPSQLEKALNGNKDVSILVNAYKLTPWDEIVQVMNMGKKLGVKVLAATQPE